MNKEQIRMEYRDGVLYGWYRTRDWNDPDDDGTPTFEAQTPADSLEDRSASKIIMTSLVNQYDHWNNYGKYD